MGKRTKKELKAKVQQTEKKQEQKAVKVSCLMLTYDRAFQKPVSSSEMFRSAVNQLCEQTFKDFEVIVVNSGSQPFFDICEQILKDSGLKYKHVHVSRNECHTIADLRNKSVELASGEFILTWDDDDYRNCDLIKTLVEGQTQTNADLVMIQNIEVQLQLGKSYPANYHHGFEPTMLARKTDKVKYVGEHSDTRYINDLKAMGYKEFVVKDNPCNLYKYCYWGNNITQRESFAKIIVLSNKMGGR